MGLGAMPRPRYCSWLGLKLLGGALEPGRQPRPAQLPRPIKSSSREAPTRGARAGSLFLSFSSRRRNRALRMQVLTRLDYETAAPRPALAQLAAAPAAQDQHQEQPAKPLLRLCGADYRAHLALRQTPHPMAARTPISTCPSASASASAPQRSPHGSGQPPQLNSSRGANRHDEQPSQATSIEVGSEAAAAAAAALAAAAPAPAIAIALACLACRLCAATCAPWRVRR